VGRHRKITESQQHLKCRCVTITAIRPREKERGHKIHSLRCTTCSLHSCLRLHGPTASLAAAPATKSLVHLMNQAEWHPSPELFFHLYNTFISARPLWPLSASMKKGIHRATLSLPNVLRTPELQLTSHPSQLPHSEPSMASHGIKYPICLASLGQPSWLCPLLLSCEKITLSQPNSGHYPTLILYHLCHAQVPHFPINHHHFSCL